MRLSNQNLTNGFRTLLESALKIKAMGGRNGLSEHTMPDKFCGDLCKASVLICALFLFQGQAHRSLPNAALVEAAKFSGETVVLRWESAHVKTPSWLVTAFDMDGRKIWSLRTRNDRL